VRTPLGEISLSPKVMSWYEPRYRLSGMIPTKVQVMQQPLFILVCDDMPLVMPMSGYAELVGWSTEDEISLNVVKLACW
ncbi:hypothetical protein HDU67_007278, partial [Dinochytrium kinnereticum]